MEGSAGLDRAKWVMAGGTALRVLISAAEEVSGPLTVTLRKHEGASTLFGPYTLSAFMTEFVSLV